MHQEGRCDIRGKARCRLSLRAWLLSMKSYLHHMLPVAPAGPGRAQQARVPALS